MSNGDYTLTGEKIYRMDKRLKYFLILITSVAIVSGFLSIVRGKLFEGLLLLINMLAAEVALIKFTTGLKEIYRSDESTEKEEMMLIIKALLIVMPVGLVTVLIFMYHLELLF